MVRVRVVNRKKFIRAIVVFVVIIVATVLVICNAVKSELTKQVTSKPVTKIAKHVEKKEKKKVVKENVEYETTTLIKEPTYTSGVSPASFRQQGVIHHNGHKFTWYSEKVLPGGGLSIPGRHVDNNGYVCDVNGYVAVASCDYPHGTVVDTPLGIQGKVYDICPSSGTIDVYVSW